MPLYERREGGRVRERVRTVPGSFEDTRLGVMHEDRAKNSGKDGWHLVDERPAAPAPATGKPKDTSGGG